MDRATRFLPVSTPPLVTARVIIESPYAGDVERNKRYAIRALRDSLQRGEAPLAFHLLYTQALNDGFPLERQLGLAASQFYYDPYIVSLVAVYDDYSISPGMNVGIQIAADRGIPIEFRHIGPNPGVNP